MKSHDKIMEMFTLWVPLFESQKKHSKSTILSIVPNKEKLALLNIEIKIGGTP